MPELPEIMNLAAQMQRELVGKTIADVQVKQPKSLNLPVEAFRQAVVGQKLVGCEARGKWLVNTLSSGWLLINLGMGGEALYHTRQEDIPVKHRLLFTFADDTYLSLNFWWFGYAHWVRDLAEHAMLTRIGVNALDPQLSLARFAELLGKRKTGVKTFLLDQSHVAGIGNMYIHDILFRARLHPARRADSLAPEEIAALFGAMQESLRLALEKGGSFWERDLYDQPGGYRKEDILIGYREGEPCPACGAPIVKLRTGANSGFICPGCQAPDPPER
jgi:formamidopyrimidine-DNA glycosylase